MRVFSQGLKVLLPGLAVVLFFAAPPVFSSSSPSSSPSVLPSSQGMRVDGAPVTLTREEEPVFWRGTQKTDNAVTITFLPLPESALKKVQEENAPDSGGKLMAKALKIGVNRNADTEVSKATSFAPGWQATGDGYVARWVVTSPEAKAMRVALQLHTLPDSAELRFSGSGAPEKIIGVVTGKEANALRNDDKVYWTPVTEGETQTIEIYLPSGIKTEDVRIRLNGASHLFVSASGFDPAVVTKRHGDSQPCNIDVACKAGSLGTAFQNVSKAVALMQFNKSDGTYTCSGTLLTDSLRSETPYFWSAAHCLNTQAEANSLNTFWHFEAASCGSSSQHASYTQLTGGAHILHVRSLTDTLLLRLNNSAPQVGRFSGWDANLFSSGSMTAIHHPRGDYKKVSIGKGEGRTCLSRYSVPPGMTLDVSKLTLVSFSEGLTEGGSSGSGLFTFANGEYYLRGGLQGGSNMTCSDTGLGPDTSLNALCYSSLAHVWNEVAPYLYPSAPSEPNNPGNSGNPGDRTGQWVKTNPEDEEAWGLSVLMNFPGNPRYLFAPWYTYDRSGNATWFIFQGDTWTDDNTFTATVQRFSGPSWGVFPYDNNEIQRDNVGTVKLTFTSDTRARFEYNVNGSSRTIDLRKLD